jgi:hypothetical protein
VSDNRAPQSGELSPEEAERLAERLKPSWEVDGQPGGILEEIGGQAPPVVPQPAALAPAPVFMAPVAPNVSPAQTAPTQPDPASSEPVLMPAGPIAAVPAGPAPITTRAAARAKHARTVLGLAPPIADDWGAPGRAPTAYAVAVPAAPISPSARPRGEASLPSVVLADSGATYPPPVATQAAGDRFQVRAPSYSDLDDDYLPLRRSSKAPWMIGLLVVVGGGVGAYTLFGPGRASAPSPAPIATPIAPAIVPPIPTILAPPSPPVPIPHPAASTAAPSPPATASAEPGAKTREPLPAKGSGGNAPPEENAASSRTRDVAPTPRNAAAPQPRPAPAKPAAAKPAPPNKPSGGIVRDVPF